MRYQTDPAQQGANGHTTEPAGIFADDFTLTAGGSTVFTDGAESGNNGWTPDKFEIVGASKSVSYDNYYVASNRAVRVVRQVPADRPVQRRRPTRPNWFEHFPYQNGLIVSYWNTQYSDNNESVHPGEGRSSRSTRTRRRSSASTG